MVPVHGFPDPLKTISADPFHVAPITLEITSDDAPDTQLGQIWNRNAPALTMKLEKTHVALFDGSKGTFEHWIQSVKYHLTQTNLIQGDNAILCQFLITHLRSGSLPEVIITSARKVHRKEGKPPNSFSLEIATLRAIFEESDNPQCAMTKASQITWNGQSDILPALYAEVLKTYSIILPRAEMAPFRARELIRIILLRNR